MSGVKPVSVAACGAVAEKWGQGASAPAGLLHLTKSLSWSRLSAPELVECDKVEFLDPNRHCLDGDVELFC